MSIVTKERPARRLWRRYGMLAAVAAVLVAGGCSSSGSGASVASLPGQGNGSSSRSTGQLTQAQGDQDMVEFTRCLRSHGVDEPDPAHIPGHSGLSVEIPPPGPATNAALSACNHFLVPIEQMKQAGADSGAAALLPALTHFAQCMRAHDIAMLDPSSDGALRLGDVPGITNDFGRYSPQFRAADGACRHLLPPQVHDDGTGP